VIKVNLDLVAKVLMRKVNLDLVAKVLMRKVMIKEEIKREKEVEN